MIDLSIPIAIRERKDTDESCIFSSWLKSYRKSTALDCVHNDIYFSEHTKVIRDILERSDTYMIVDPVDDDHIYGYACIEFLNGIGFKGKNHQILHFAYVKHPFRRMGLMHRLLGEVMPEFGEEYVFISHLPRNYYTLSEKYKLYYNPYLQRG